MQWLAMMEDASKMTTTHAFCSIGKGFPTHQTLLLVLNQFDALSIESLLQLGEIDICSVPIVSPRLS